MSRKKDIQEFTIIVKSYEFFKNGIKIFDDYEKLAWNRNRMWEQYILKKPNFMDQKIRYRYA